MRYNHLILFNLLALATTAQETSLSNLKAPQSPAASIIGLQPSSISRPKSWEALESALFSNFYSQGALAVPNDFALEFSPFWASNKKKMSIERFLSPTWGQSFVQNLAFSVASTQAFQLNDSLKSNAIGFGVRTMLIGGKASTKRVLALYGATLDLSALANKLYKAAELAAGGNAKLPLTDNFLDQNLRAAWKTNADVLKLTKGSASAADSMVTSLVELLRGWLKKKTNATIEDLSDGLDEVTGLDQHVKDLTQARDDPRGFRLELAASSMVNFPTNQSDYSFVPKAGVWLTPSYQHPKWNSFEVLGVVRYLWYKSEYFRRYDTGFSSFDRNFDAGLRLVLKKEKFSLEGEAVWRWSSITVSESFDEATGETTTISKSEDDLQYLVNLNYQLKENLTLSYTFGKQLDPQLNLNIGGDVVSLLALNVGFGAPKAGKGEVIR